MADQANDATSDEATDGAENGAGNRDGSRAGSAERDEPSHETSKGASKDADRGIETELDVPVDEATAASRATGGAEDAEGPDAVGTTGTGVSGEFVGRVSGQDEGYAGRTGAEVRAGDDGNSGGALGD